MKIVLATQEEPFYLPLFVARFLAATDATVAGAVVGEPFNGTKDWLGVVRNHWRWYGTPVFVAQGVRFARRKIVDRLRPDHDPPYSLRAALNRRRVPIWPMTDVNDPAFVDRARTESIDCFVSVAYPRVVKTRTLDAFPHGGINFHLGPLPRYRGLNPLFWSLLNGEASSAVTIHRMVKALDAGPILAQQPFPLKDLTSLDAAYHRAIEIGPALLADVVRQLAAGIAVERPNPPEQATYFGFPTAADGAAFRRAGKRFW